MSSEITVREGFFLRKVVDGVVVNEFQGRPNAYTNDMAGVGGPSPGTIIVTHTGVDVSFAQLTDPGHCWICNQDPDDNVQLGLRHTATGLFIPFLQLQPGKPQQVYLDPDFGREEAGTGSALSGAATIRLKAPLGKTCLVFVGGFER